MAAGLRSREHRYAVSFDCNGCGGIYPVPQTRFSGRRPGHMPEHIESEAEVCAYILSLGNPDKDFATNLAQLQKLNHEERFKRLLEYLRQKMMPQATMEDLESLFRVLTQNLANMWNWKPQPHDTKLLFCKATEQTALVARNPELAWIPMASEGIEILPVPGDHSTMFEPPHVATLAKEINRRLASAIVV